MFSNFKSCATLIVCSTLLMYSSCMSPQCKDERGDPVDWFYIYKLPRQKNHTNPLIRSGIAYMYLTPSMLHGGWVVSGMGINNPLSMLGRTLAPLYTDASTLSVLYNDQPPTTSSEVLKSLADMYDRSRGDGMKQTKRFKRYKLDSRLYDDNDLAEMCKMHARNLKMRQRESGHTKGVLLGDKHTALWLVHSVPRFPPIPDVHGVNLSSYDYPTTGMRYGQSMLCMSVHTTTLNDIGTQLKYNEPLVVYSQIPQDFVSVLPNLVDVVHNRTVNSAPWYHTQGIETLSGRKFLSFAKSSMFHDDLYSGLVAHALHSDLLVETWINGAGTLDSECSKEFQVYNIEGLKLLMANMSFTSHHDHSKWAVAVIHKLNGRVTNSKWVCVGDINRAVSQESRGGGTVCTSEPILWENFAYLVDSVQACKE